MFYLYRHFSATGTLLYIGITHDLESRWMQHSDESPWFSEIAEVNTESFPTKEEALAAEREAITAEHPLHNIESRRLLSHRKPANRQRNRRDRMRSIGYVLKHTWIHKDDETEYLNFVEQLAMRRGA